MLRFKRRKLEKTAAEVGKITDIAKPALKASPVSADLKAQPDLKIKAEVKTEDLKPGKVPKAAAKTEKTGKSRVLRVLAKIAYVVTKNYLLYRHRLRVRRLKKKGIPG